MSWYKTGTVTVTNGSPTITGAGGTLWVDAGTLNAGDIISILGVLYEIQSINSNTGITLASNYLAGSGSGVAYAIMPIGLLPSALAQQVKSTLTTANTALASAVRFDTATQGLTSGQQQNARTNIAALGAADVGYGRLSKSVAGGADVALTATEAANQFIETTGAQTANINVTVPAAARLFMWFNNTTGAYTQTVKTAAGTGVVVPQGARAILECDGTNVVTPLTALGGNLAMPSTSKLFLDGGDDTYISETTANQIDIVAGGGTYFRLTAGNLSLLNSSTLTVTGDLYVGASRASQTGFVQHINVEGSDASIQLYSTTAGVAWEMGGDSDGVLRFLKGGSDRARITAAGYFKASNSGTYANPGGIYHEFHQNDNTGAGYACVFTNAAATITNQNGAFLKLQGDPNNASNFFFQGVGNTTERFAARSNGGIANYQANDVNLSDERLKTKLNPLASPAWGVARTLGELIEEGEYSDAPGRRLLTMRAQRVEQAGFDRLVDRNVRSGLALMRGLHEQQIDMYFRKATAEVLAWADEEVRPALTDYGARLARIEQHLNLN